MSRQKIAEFFIKTLTELRDEDRRRKQARLRLQHKAKGERYLQKFGSGYHEQGHPQAFSPRARMSAQEARNLTRDE